jgi:hypothetical protein
VALCAQSRRAGPARALEPALASIVTEAMGDKTIGDEAQQHLSAIDALLVQQEGLLAQIGRDLHPELAAAGRRLLAGFRRLSDTARTRG